MAKRFQSGRCVHCLSPEAELTSDHVFPKSWYPDSTPNDIERWQIPSCRRCNHAFGKIEEDLFYRLGMCVDDDAVESLGVGRRVIDALNPARGRNERDKKIRSAKAMKLLAERKLVSSGIKHECLTRAPGNSLMTVSKQPLKKLCEKIVRGLVWIKLQKFIDSAYELTIDVSASTQEDFEALVAEYGETYERGPGIEVRWAKLPGDPVCGLYKIRIFGKLVMRAVITPVDAAPKEYNQL